VESREWMVAESKGKGVGGGGEPEVGEGLRQGGLVDNIYG